MTQAEEYFNQMINQKDWSMLKCTKKIVRGKEVNYIEPIYEGMNINAYWWPKELEDKLTEIRNKQEECRTPYEIDLFNCAYKFFMQEMCEFDDFVDWETYVRFINTLSDDFFDKD